MIQKKILILVVACENIYFLNLLAQLNYYDIKIKYQAFQNNKMENDIQPLTIYKNKHEIANMQQLPVSHSDRICTDLFCTILSTLFAIAMLLLACINFNLNKLVQTTYPTDINGRLCTRDNNYYNYLYFASPTDTTKRLCVANCPVGNETYINCLPSDNLSCKANSNPQYEVLIYPTIPSDTSMGLFCMPTDQKLKSIILQRSKLKQKYLFISAYRSILYSALFAIALGFIFLILTSCLPKFMNYTAIIVGGLGCISTGIALFLVNSELLQAYKPLKIICGVLVILVGLMCLSSLIFNLKDLQICTNYLNYAGQFLKKALVLIVFVFIFYILLAGLFALIIFQMLAFWSHGQVQFHLDFVYKTLENTFSTIMVIICGFQLLWGLAFLKESFNFIISAISVFYYFSKQFSISFALKNLFMFHWGSVVAGSFLLDFFYIFDIFYDFIKPRSRQWRSKFQKVCCCCDRILGLSRSDTFSFLNLIGQPYCNSARYCEEIDDRSDTFDGSQSVFRFFRIGSHVLLASICTCLTFFFMKYSQNQISILVLIASFIVNLFVVTFFVSLIAQIAEATSLCSLVQNYIKNEHQLPVSSQRPKNFGVISKNKGKQNKLNEQHRYGKTIHETNF